MRYDYSILTDERPIKTAKMNNQGITNRSNAMKQ